MSPLVLVLATTMTVPANGPGAVSAETEQGLDLSGEWEGVWWMGPGFGWDCSIENGKLFVGDRKFGASDRLPFVDMGGGRILFLWDDWCEGIYREEGHRLLLCFRRPGKGTPSSFEADARQTLFDLRRVRPRK